MKIAALISMIVAYALATIPHSFDWSNGAKDLLVEWHNVAKRLAGVDMTIESIAVHVGLLAQKTNIESKLANLAFDLDNAFKGTIYETLKLSVDGRKNKSLLAESAANPAENASEIKSEQQLQFQSLRKMLKQEKNSLKSYRTVFVDVIRLLNYVQDNGFFIEKRDVTIELQRNLKIIADNDKHPERADKDMLKAEILEAKIDLVSLLLKEEQVIKRALELREVFSKKQFALDQAHEFLDSLESEDYIELQKLPGYAQYTNSIRLHVVMLEQLNVSEEIQLKKMKLLSRKLSELMENFKLWV